MNISNNPNEVVDALLGYVEKEDFSGWDPYDSLNSDFLLKASLGNKYIRAGITQFFRRSSINLRPLFKIKKGHNPKGLGLFLESYSKLYKLRGNEEYLTKIDRLLNLLEQTISEGYTGNSWGYNFPWQSRVVFKPRWTPTIVNTSFIGHALLYCHEFTGKEKALKLASSISDWMLNDLNRKIEGDTFCFSYSPIDEEYVHNANMLGASFLVRYGKLTNNEELIKAAHQSLKFSINAQNADGSWYFAVLKTHHWVDSFHTGFKLESIRWFIELNEGEEYQESYKKGIEFYKDNFFLSDGTPKYYHDKVYPIDIHAPAEAIYFFSKFDDKSSEDLTKLVSDWVINNMYDPKKHYFYFRKSKNGHNKISYMRWTQSWILRGLSEYIYNKG